MSLLIRDSPNAHRVSLWPLEEGKSQGRDLASHALLSCCTCPERQGCGRLRPRAISPHDAGRTAEGRQPTSFIFDSFISLCVFPLSRPQSFLGDCHHHNGTISGGGASSGSGGNEGHGLVGADISIVSGGTYRSAQEGSPAGARREWLAMPSTLWATHCNRHASVTGQPRRLRRAAHGRRREPRSLPPTVLQ
jgi:hypothetical protein